MTPQLVTRLASSAVFLALAAARVASQLPAADSAAEFKLAASWTLARTSTVAPLRRAIALNLEGASVKQALHEIGRVSGIHIAYGDDVLRSHARVSVHADGMTVREALVAVLEGTGLDAFVSLSGKAVLVRAIGVVDSMQTGSVTGRVTEAKTGHAIAGASVVLVGTRWHATTGDDGQYRLEDVTAASYTLTVSRIGYAKQSQAVTVAMGQELTIDVTLDILPTELERVVVTATGPQRKREVGNLIETIAADSIVATGPITSLTDVISARAPGVQVFSSGGFTGASPQINIRGQNSFTLSNQPLLYIDGVRVENSAASNASAINQGTGLFAGRFNDLDPNEVESVEVVKGPSAATLYGTDAANGVILIKTKHGLAGPPRWSFFASGGLVTTDRGRFPDSYTAWGHPTGGGPTQMCRLAQVAAGSCVQDSITSFSPFKDPTTTPIATGYRQEYGAQVSGGSDRVRYFFSAAYLDEIAPLRMPSIDAAMVDSIRGGSGSVAGDELRPNALRKVSLHQNVTVDLSPTADVTISTGLIDQSSRIPNNYLWFSGSLGPGYRNANDGWFALLGRPSDRFVERHSEAVKHLTASVSSNWRPWTWLAVRGTTGVDYSTDFFDYLIKPGEDPAIPDFGVGSRSNEKTNIALYTADLGATGTFGLSEAVRSKTSVGVQYNRRQFETSAASATNLVPGSATVAGGSTQTASESSIEGIVAGAYAEQAFSIHDRLYLTGGIRFDGGSAFGADFRTSAYPKASVSWLVPPPPHVSSLRLRAAYGASGVQPGATDALATVTTGPAVTPGGAAIGGSVGSLGNPQLKPERQTELEAGADIELVNGAVHIEGTYYRKRSSDALVALPLPPSVGGGSQLINVGSVQNWGLEGLVRADLLHGNGWAWNVTLNASVNHNKLLTLAPGVPSLLFGEVVPGYPLLSFFEYPITSVKDLNGDGIIEPNEVTIGTKPVFLGSRLPTSQLTVGTAFTVLDGRLRIATQFDRRGGFTLERFIELNRCYFGVCRAVNDPKASLSDQAAFVAARSYGVRSGFLQDGSFTRWRELAISYTLPGSFARRLGAQTGMVTLSARNLALWTKWGGIDPESNGVVSGFSNGIYADRGAPPQSSYWLLRLDLGL
jgi:TonB-linked SusC/RagA family outer membrane protein